MRVLFFYVTIRENRRKKETWILNQLKHKNNLKMRSGIE
jgi:hypothetical protein